jgi:hypothetical protein
MVEQRQAPAALQAAARVIDEAVRRLQPRVEPDLAPRDAGGAWAASYALANFYRDGEETVGAHSGAAISALEPLQYCNVLEGQRLVCMSHGHHSRIILVALQN